MKKSLIALLLVVALVVTVSVFAVSAETNNPFYGQTEIITAECECCGTDVQWAPALTDTSAGVTWWDDYKTNGYTHFYLTADSLIGSSTSLAEGVNICINLNGFTWARKTNGNFFTVNGGTLGIMDTSDDQTGTMDIPFTANNKHITVNSGTANQYAGALTNSLNAAKGANGGCVYMAGGTYNMYGGSMNAMTSWAGGAVHMTNATFNMYGGTIHGESASNGGALCAQGNSIVNISGGTMTGKATNGAIVYLTGTYSTKVDGVSTSVTGHVTLNLSGTASLGSETVQSVATTAGAIYPNGNCTVNIDGGTIQNCKATNGGALVGNSSTAALNMTGGTIKNCTADTAGGAIRYAAAMQTYITGGTITECKAPLGGAIAADGSYAPTINFGGTAKITECETTSKGKDSTYLGGAVYVSKGTFNMTGGTISNCKASRGGAIYLTSADGAATISGGTIENCFGYDRGGSVCIMSSATATVSGTAEIKGGYVSTAGNKFGGNIYAESALNISGGTISGGTIEGADYEANTGASGLYGGNVCARGGAITMTDGEISKGYANIGGNVYLRNTTHNITGGTIKEGKAYSYGGNLGTYSGSGGTNTAVINLGAVTIKGGIAKKGGNIAYLADAGSLTLDGTKVSGGQSSNMGGNIYIANGNTVTITGDSVIDGTGTTCHASANLYGNNIAVGDFDSSGTAGNLILSGNAKIINGLVDKNEDGKINNSDYNSVIIGNGSTVQLNGNASVDRLFFRTGTQDADATVTANEGFVGVARIWHADSSVRDTVVPGADAPASVAANGYTGTASLYVYDGSSSQKMTAWDATNSKLIIAGMAKVVAGDEEGERLEYGITDLSEAPALTEGHVKLYQGGEVALIADAIIDINNQNVTFDNTDYKLSVIEYRTDDCTTVGTDAFTVTSEDNLNKVSVDPATGYQYVITGDATTGFNANRVKMDIASVSIKPSTAGIYYTTTIAGNANVAANAISYGVVLSTADMPAADFATDLNDSGMCENLYTEIDLDETEAFAYTTNSALLVGILNQDAAAGQNKTWGEYPIYANAFVCFSIGGEDVYVMAENTYELSLLDILKIVDETAPSKAAVLEMYETWQDPMATWAEEGHLANIKAAYEAAA